MNKIFYEERSDGIYFRFDGDCPDDMKLATFIINYLTTLGAYHPEGDPPYTVPNDEHVHMEILTEEWENLQSNEELLGIEFVEYEKEG